MAKKKMTPETRAALVEIRREVRVLIDRLQAKLDAAERP
jgi:hypothetical protein